MYDGLAHPWLKYLCHQSLIGCSGVFQANRHHIVAVYPVWCNERHFLRIKQVHRNLMVAGEGVQK